MHRTFSGLAPVLFIPGLLFEALIHARCALYSADLLPKRRLPAPVISIGNITMGGAGKTPLVIYVAQMLAKLGFNPAVLSRGYGRIEPKTILVLSPGETVSSPARILGDEPALIRRHIPSAFMGIAQNRFLAGDWIAKKQSRILFVLDDGFQHRKLHRDLDIVIIDGSQPLGSNRVFPRGTLREPLSELRRCQVIMINGAQDGARTPCVTEEVRRHHPTAVIFYCRQTIQRLVPLPGWKEDSGSQSVSAPPAYLVAALGNPARFREDVEKLGIEIRGTKFFPDHYWIKQKDWVTCIEEARRKNAGAIIITEKDAVKISHPPDFPLLVSVQSTEVSNAQEFEHMLKKCAGERS
jgi:tetraacyldisaccharide 4'-kinase